MLATTFLSGFSQVSYDLGARITWKFKVILDHLEIHVMPAGF